MSATSDSESSGTTTSKTMISSTEKSHTTKRRDIFVSLLKILEYTGELREYVSICEDDETTCEMQVAIVLNYLKKYKLVPFHKTDKLGFGKDSKVSTDLRNEGSTYFMKRNERALLLYSKSIAAAPYPASDQEVSEELALGFANRSAVYFAMKKYDACLRDIEQALPSFPDKLKYKLLERRAKCFQRLGKQEEARASAQETVKHVSTATYLSEEKMKSIVDAMTKLQVGPGSGQGNPPEESKPLPQKAFGQHEDIPCASECVDIAYNPRVGRYFVANRDVDPGEVLFVEEPFATLLEPNYYLTHCNNCTKRSDAMIPCEKCDQVMYCSEVCRRAAWESFHSVECRILPELGKIDVGSEDKGNLLALRVFLISCSKYNGIVGLFKAIEKLEQTTSYKNNIKGFDENGKYLSNDYHQIHYLHEHDRKEPNARLTVAATAACVLNCLQEHTDFFSKTSDSNIPLEKLYLFAGGLIFKLVQVIWVNAFTVVDYESQHVAAGVYSTLSLLNHSCNATSCKVVHSGSSRVVIARLPIRKGEEISTTYVEYFENMDAMTRQMKLRITYGFKCDCIACVNKWPEYRSLPMLDSSTFICKTCRIPLAKKSLKVKDQMAKCSSCSETFNVSLMYKEADRVDRRLKHLSTVHTELSAAYLLVEAANMIKSVDSILLSPNQLMCNCQELLATVVKRKI